MLNMQKELNTDYYVEYGDYASNMNSHRKGD